MPTRLVVHLQTQCLFFGQRDAAIRKRLIDSALGRRQKLPRPPPLIASSGFGSTTTHNLFGHPENTRPTPFRWVKRLSASAPLLWLDAESTCSVRGRSAAGDSKGGALLSAIPYDNCSLLTSTASHAQPVAARRREAMIDPVVSHCRRHVWRRSERV